MTRRITIATLATLGGLLGVFLVLQLVPYRVSNPPVLAEAAWDSPRTADLARRACFDCHSNEVNVPWYGYVAPTSWLVASHVDEARSKLNFSEMNLPQKDAGEAGEEVSKGEMPPAYYLALHPEARLTDAERKELAAGLDATLGGDGAEGDDDEVVGVGEHDDDDDDD